MEKELTGMRITCDEVVIKPLNEANNRILNRRKLSMQNNFAPVIEPEDSGQKFD